MANMAVMLGCTLMLNAAQGHPRSVLLSHSQRIRSARQRVSKLWIPNPPSSSGQQARSHATGQCPPFTCRHPFHI